MRCKNEMERNGEKHVPRTCPRCGITGPCQVPGMSRPMSEFPLTASDRAQLKQIAGLIQKLSYRDMQDLAHKLSERLSDKTPKDVAESLLLVCDRILAPVPVDPHVKETNERTRAFLR
jgi:hypothetical protein